MRTVTANFSGGQTFVATESLWQYDYGFVLVLQGLELPTYYEVHFSHTFTQLADVNIGDANGVAIDDKFLRKDGYLFAWVYLHDEVTDGYTKYQVKIPIAKRAKPPEDPPTHEQQEALAQAITALNEQTGRAEGAADRAEQAEVNAKASEDAAALSEQNASGSAEAAASSERNAAQFELDAAASAATAMDKASDAAQAANAAIAAANTAEGAAGSVIEDARRAETAATHAEQYSDAAQIAKEGAVASEQAAQRHKNDAVDAKEAAQSAASTATQKAQAAEDYAGIASQKAEVATDKALEATLSATDASGSASNAAVSETQAEISATAAGNAETEAKTARDLAQGYATDANESKLAAVAAQGYAETAQGKAETAQGKAEDAQAAAETAQGLAETAQDAAEDAALESEGYAKGTQDGTAVESGSPYYQANAKYYKEQAAESAAAAAASAASLTVDSELSDTSTNPVQNKVIDAEIVYIKDHLLDMYPTDEASGTIASFPDGANNVPLKSCVVNLSPVQDLHGQDSPYPAGGGPNLLPFEDVFTEGWTNTVNGITATYSKGYMRITGTNTSSDWTNIVYFRIAWYNNPFEFGAGDYAMPNYLTIVCTVDGVTKNNGNPFTANESVSVQGFYIAVQGGLTVDWNVPLVFARASTRPTTYSPYENICPISGHTGVEANVAGHNVWDEEWEVGTINDSTGADKTGSNVRSKNYIPVVPDTTYYFYAGTGTAVRLFYYGVDKSFLGYTDTGSVTFTTPSTAYYCRFRTFNIYGNTYNHDISINYPSTDTEYEPYNGNSYSVTWPDEVFGGSAEVVEGEGHNTKEFFERPLSDAFLVLEYTNTKRYRYQNIFTNPVIKAGAISNFAPHYYNADDFVHFYVDGRNCDVFVPKDTELSVIIQVCAETTTPSDFTITPTPVSTLEGDNNIWSNGDSVEVEYCADTKLYIDKKLAALVAALS